MSKQLRSFWFHYNRPQSKVKGHTVISIHYLGRCIFVKNIVCNVKTAGRLRKSQPHFVVAGKAKSISIRDEIAYVE